MLHLNQQKQLLSRYFSSLGSLLYKEPMDGNTAASSIAYMFSDVAFIYPITPSSQMGEMADYWAAHGKKNLFGDVLSITEMQSEGGAAGGLHGALSSGCLASTYTASQGLLLMIPNLYKLAGELLPGVLHVSARAVAGEALSIFGDHSDVMATRETGCCLLASSSVQEAQDMAAIAHVSAIDSSLPFIHFFDGFRTSSEINTIEVLEEDVLKKMINYEKIREFKNRALNPEHPYLKGTNQGPDIYMQQVERVNPYYLEVPSIVEKAMNKFGDLTSRKYELFEYFGHPEAENVVVIMGSGVSTVKQVVNYLTEHKNEKVGVVVVKLYRPFASEYFLKKLPKTTKRIAVMDRTKEPGSIGEPLKLDIIATLRKYKNDPKHNPNEFAVDVIVGGRYGLGSKEFAPEHALSIFDNLKNDVANIKDAFTVGIVDDVTFTSLPLPSMKERQSLEKFVFERSFQYTPSIPSNANLTQCIFWGLGSDGTVGANKDAVKLLVKGTKSKDYYGQAYFAYSAHKSGGLTQSYLRFTEGVPFEAPYLIRESQSDYVACHSSDYIKKYDLLRDLKENGTFVLNHSATTLDQLEKILPNGLKRSIAEKNAEFYVVDANAIANECGLGQRINTIMQTVFFKLMNKNKSDNTLIELFKDSIKKQYAKKGDAIIKQNIEAVDKASDLKSSLNKIEVPKEWKEIPFEALPPFFFESEKDNKSVGAEKKNIPEFIDKVQFPINQLKGDDLPVSVFPPGGVLPVGTCEYEKRFASEVVPSWEPKKCIQCNYCGTVCPHAAIRPILFSEKLLGKEIPSKFSEKSKKAVGLKNLPEGVDDVKFKIQISARDCTGCQLCTEICPAKCLTMSNGDEERVKETANWNYASSIEMKKHSSEIWKLYSEKPKAEKKKVQKKRNLKSVGFETPLLEFSGSCAGCSETSVAKTLTQLFGEQMIIQNATGCSSIWGGTYPWNPYTVNPKSGYGPAWANSLFEDNAENGLGIAVGYRHRRESLHKDMTNTLEKLEKLPKSDAIEQLKQSMKDLLNVENFLDRESSYEVSESLKPILGNVLKTELPEDIKKELNDLYNNSDLFAKKSVWVLGGDGWAYDIGYGGLDHVLASGEDLNILVFDTEVYSNTGGQTSKATVRSAVAKFSENGKPTGKKDLAAMAISYENVYVATCNAYADPNQLIKALQEAEAYKGVSLVICYSNCIAHGTTYNKELDRVNEMKIAVESGYFPLIRYNPDDHKFTLDAPKKPDEKKLEKFLNSQARFKALKSQFPEEFDLKQKLLKSDVKKRNKRYQLFAKYMNQLFEE